MKTDDAIADQVLNRTLIQVRRAKSRRQTRRAMLISCPVLLLGIYLAAGPKAADPESSSPVAQTTIEVPTPSMDKLVVVVWRNGSPLLEEVGADEWGKLDLQFSLEPVVTYADAQWSTF